MRSASAHASLVHGARGAVLNLTWLEPESPVSGWGEVQEAWARPQRNGRPTPWSGLVGKPSARSQGGWAAPSENKTNGSASDSHQGLGDLLSDVLWVDAEHYVVRPPLGEPTSQLMSSGYFTWRYLGQAVFRVDPVREAPAWRDPPVGFAQAREADSTAPRVEARLMRYDRFGRVWILDDVDTAQLAEHIRRYDRDGGEPEEQATAGIVWPDSGGEPQFITPNAWEFLYCDGETEAIWGFEPSVETNPAEPLDRSPNAGDNVRGQRTVQVSYGSVTTNPNPEPGESKSSYSLTRIGSGSVVGSRAVLTAKHVVSGHPASELFITPEGAGVRGVEAVVRQGGEDDDDTGDRDWAVLELDEEVSVSPFFLSRRASSLVNFGTNLRGYPGPEVDTSTPCHTPLNQDQFKAHGAVEAIGVFDEVLTTASSATGMSGGPYYYCWTGDCDEGSAQTAVHKGWTGFHTFGPLVSPIRDTILGAAA